MLTGRGSWAAGGGGGFFSAENLSARSLARAVTLLWPRTPTSTSFNTSLGCLDTSWVTSTFWQPNNQQQATPPTHPCNGPLSRTNRVSRYQKSKTNLDFTEARDSEWQWHQLGHMQVCTLHHANTSPLSFLQAGRPSCCPTNSIKNTESIKLVLHPIRHKICHFRDVLPRKSLGWVPLKPVQLLFKQHKTE